MATAWFNGEWIEDTSPVFDLNHRITRYGDGFFESILSVQQPLWVETHYGRILKSAAFLGIELPDYFSLPFFRQLLIEIVQKNSFTSARIRFTVYRNAEGNYSPSSNKAGLYATAAPHAVPGEMQIIKEVGFYEEIKKPVNLLSSVKSSNALLYVLAAKHAGERGWDDCILLNEANNVCEASSSNVFVIKNNIIKTPALTEGCVEGVMRTILLQNCSIVEGTISKQEWMDAEALFITNAIQGIRAIERIGNKTFDTTAVQKIYAAYRALIANYAG